MKTTHCFYEPGNMSLIDTATADNRGTYSGETLDQIRKRYPRAELMDIDEACKQADEAQRKHYVHGPKEITAERFDEMLNVLPPVDWKHGPGGKSFKMEERMIGMLTSIFCEVDGRFFELCDDTRNSHEWVMRECRKVIDAGKMID